MADPQKALLALFDAIVAARLFTPGQALMALEDIMPHLDDELGQEAMASLRADVEQALGAELPSPRKDERGRGQSGVLPGMPGSTTR